MSTTTQNARPSGPEIRQQVVGAPMGKPATAPGGADPFLAPFFETAIEHVWGGVWNRPGLELKYRSLVVVSVLAATGHNEELKTHLRGALNLGWTVDELREALRQDSPLCGLFRGKRGAAGAERDRHTELTRTISTRISA